MGILKIYTLTQKNKNRKMVYRRKLILALVESFGGKLNATDFQKLLFIFSEKQIEKSYEFIPYKFGCFSFQAMSDKNSLIKEGYLLNVNNWELDFENANFSFTLKAQDRKLLEKLKIQYSDKTTKDLIRYVYLNYPYFAINSEITYKYLTVNEQKIVSKFKPNKSENGLYTIGYEGRSLENYLNILIQNDIRVLCDVRKNPISRKYGFSKRTLQNACESIKIKYIHIPELGIISEKRKKLNTQKDYDKLFADYNKTIISSQSELLNYISKILDEHNRIALTCFESSPNQCHRTCVADAIHNMDNNISVKHL